jgi:hypothetical protein
MIWNFANTVNIGCFVKVYDSRGTFFSNLISIDTDTGIGIQHKRDADDKLILDRENQCLVQEEILLSLPVKITCKECEEELHIEADNDCSYCARRNRFIKSNI